MDNGQRRDQSSSSNTRSTWNSFESSAHSFCEFMLLPFAVHPLYELYLLMQLECTSIWFIDNFKLLNVKSLSCCIIELRCIGRCLMPTVFNTINLSLYVFRGIGTLCEHPMSLCPRCRSSDFFHSGMKFTFFCVHVFSSDEFDIGKLHKCRSKRRHWVCMRLLLTMRRIVSHFSIVWNFHWRVDPSIASIFIVLTWKIYWWKVYRAKLTKAL